MPGFKIGGISLGKSTKKYLRNTDFDNNTTMDFGFCQPLFCQFLLPDSNISVSAKQLVRLAPMPVPSFARVSLVNKFVFVPWSDICGYYEAMLSNMPYNGSVVPTELPYVYNAYLSKCLLDNSLGSVATFYEVDTTVPSPITYKMCTAMDALKYSNSLQTQWETELSSHVCNKKFTLTPAQYKDSAVSPNSADYLVNFVSGEKDVIAAFRYSTRAKHLRSVLIGLGYSLAMQDWSKVIGLPLFAFYKAWFDTYAPKRSVAWTDTPVFKILKSVSDDYLPNLCNDEDNMDSVLSALSDCYYVSNDDYVSVHRADISNVGLSSFSYVDPHGLINATDEFSKSQLPYLNPYPNELSLIALDVVKRLTRFVNKDSLIGQKMSTWVRNHFNAQVANSLYQDVYQVKTDILPLQINDVFSTADTADASSQSGERLGSYAGKGIGFGDTGCKFHSDRHGYLLCISAIVPKSGYFQGNDTSLYGLDRFTLPSADFDALGMEVTPFGFIAGDIGYTDMTASSDQKLDYSAGFGFVPRFSGYKFKKNIVNGDMSRRSLIDSMSPYYLDRILQTGDALYQSLADNKFAQIRRFYPSLPKASEQWRYLTRYPWLGDYDRIFYNDDVYHGSTSTPVDSSSEDIDGSAARPDNFIVQSLFTMKIQDVLKPLAMSFDTFDEDSDNNSQVVNPE
nr:MAG TPA: Major capsid protein [Microviridae sp.]